MHRHTFEAAVFSDLSHVQAAAHQERVALDVMKAVWSRRHLVVALAVLTAGLAIAVVISKPARFPAEAIIELRVGRTDPSAVGLPPPAVVVDAGSVVVSEARLLRSPAVAQRVVRRLGLAEDPSFAGQGRLSQVTDWFRRIIRGAPPEGEGTAEARREAAAVRALSAGLQVETDNRSYLITVTFATGDAAQSARIVDAVVDEYLAGRLESTLDVARRTVTWLDAQIASTETQLRSATESID
ncbi:MAG: hypothetical protein IRY90_18600, partial [Actinomadura rubrobrunea]|nr:hypothetical protein [Actinomadura rubrobrunea]